MDPVPTPKFSRSASWFSAHGHVSLNIVGCSSTLFDLLYCQKSVPCVSRIELSICWYGTDATLAKFLCRLSPAFVFDSFFINNFTHVDVYFHLGHMFIVHDF
jgi:hypothetical protein